jgi:flotillin
LQRMLVEKMPEIIAAAASELANANVTVLNGADGMGQLLAGLAGQAGQLMKLVQNGVGLNGQSALTEGGARADGGPLEGQASAPDQPAG